ncbi:MAG TPA: hypothetical protein VIV11_05510 [Kofleriaceae bacterium]
MPAIDFPRRLLPSLQEHAARLVDSRKPKTDIASLARDLFAGFFDICVRAGLDRVLVELEQAFAPLDTSDRSAFYDHPTLVPALVAQIEAIDLDGGGPRNAKPGQLANCVIAALGLTLADEADQTIALPGNVRAEVVTALAGAVDAELSVPQMRNTIIANARELCEPRYLPAFDKIAAQLDDRGMRMMKQPKVPLDAVQAVQRQLVDARNALIDRVARTAIDRAKAVIARADAAAADRIDQPITHRLTPRDVAIQRAADARVPRTPAAVAESLLDSLTELVHIVWHAPERSARPYAANQTFAVGELIDHPKFGRGAVISRDGQRIEVEFADGKHTLVHVRPSK